MFTLALNDSIPTVKFVYCRTILNGCLFRWIWTTVVDDIVVDFKISSWNYSGKNRWMGGKPFLMIADILFKFRIGHVLNIRQNQAVPRPILSVFANFWYRPCVWFTYTLPASPHLSGLPDSIHSDESQSQFHEWQMPLNVSESEQRDLAFRNWKTSKQTPISVELQWQALLCRWRDAFLRCYNDWLTCS
jgi:hypothetical protein